MTAPKMIRPLNCRPERKAAPVTVTARAYPTLAAACAAFYAPKRGCGCGRCGR